MVCPQAVPVFPQTQNRPLIIPIFIPHAGCPHQCAFCNQMSITGQKPRLPSARDLERQIQTFLSYKRDHRTRVQVAFYGGNFLGLKYEAISRLLTETTRFVRDGQVDSIRFSTRPDTIDKARLDIIREFPVKTVELGIQSMDDIVLARAERGHTVKDTCDAVALLHERNYEIGAQMMVGLPGDTHGCAMDTGCRIAALKPAFVRIYPTVVLSGSHLARWYEAGRYAPLSLDACVTLVKELYLMFCRHNIPVIRMGLQASEDLDNAATVLAGPYHPAFGHLVYSDIFLDKAIVLLENCPPNNSVAVTLTVHPHSISRMRGLKNKNLDVLKKQYSIDRITVLPDPSLGNDQVTLTWG
jgi:histone acetyltransferase (RNA polymerase elongator complex component)